MPVSIQQGSEMRCFWCLSSHAHCSSTFWLCDCILPRRDRSVKGWCVRTKGSLWRWVANRQVLQGSDEPGTGTGSMQSLLGTVLLRGLTPLLDRKGFGVHNVVTAQGDSGLQSFFAFGKGKRGGSGSYRVFPLKGWVVFHASECCAHRQARRRFVRGPLATGIARCSQLTAVRYVGATAHSSLGGEGKFRNGHSPPTAQSPSPPISQSAQPMV
jgi:hypothetical protein